MGQRYIHQYICICSYYRRRQLKWQRRFAFTLFLLPYMSSILALAFLRCWYFGSSIELLCTFVAVLLFIVKEKAMQTLELIICLHVGVVIAVKLYLYVYYPHTYFVWWRACKNKIFSPPWGRTWKKGEGIREKVRAELIYGREGEKRLMAIKPTLYIFRIRNALLLISLSIQQLNKFILQNI